MTSVAEIEAVLMGRLLNPKRGTLPMSVARAILKIDFPEDDKARIRELSGLAQARELTDEEVEEMEAYDRLGHFLALWHAKARRILKQNGDR